MRHKKKEADPTASGEAAPQSEVLIYDTSKRVRLWLITESQVPKVFVAHCVNDLGGNLLVAFGRPTVVIEFPVP